MLDEWLNVLLVECSNDLIVGLLDFGWRNGWMYILYLLDTIQKFVLDGCWMQGVGWFIGWLFKWPVDGMIG